MADVEYVINLFFPPGDIDQYVHRIGRTGRAGNNGVAHTIFTRTLAASAYPDVILTSSQPSMHRRRTTSSTSLTVLSSKSLRSCCNSAVLAAVVAEAVVVAVAAVVAAVVADVAASGQTARWRAAASASGAARDASLLANAILVQSRSSE